MANGEAGAETSTLSAVPYWTLKKDPRLEWNPELWVNVANFGF